MPTTSQRLRCVKPSPTKAITKKARELKASGRNIITLSQGAPEFDTPAHICEAAKLAIDKGETRYTDVAGKLSLREAISDHIYQCDDVSLAPEQISVGCGAKQVVFNTLMAILSDGDEVIVPAPYWVSYPDMVKLCDGKPIIVECSADTGFKLTADALKNAITPKTRCILLNSPNNPSGAVYSASELSALADVLADYSDITIISDEIYRNIYYNGHFAPSMMAHYSRLSDRLIVVNGVSKAYAMTGWRMGYGAGSIELIKLINTIQSQSSSHTCSIAQAAAQAAYEGPQEPVQAFTQAFKLRRNTIVKQLRAIQGLDVLEPEGAFYVFVSCKQLYGCTAPDNTAIESDMDIANYLLEHYDLAVVPGTAFGTPGYFRISYATDDELLNCACNRLADACQSLVGSKEDII